MPSSGSKKSVSQVILHNINSSRSRFSRRREMVAKNNNGSVANLAPIDLLCSSCGLPSSVLGDLQYHGAFASKDNAFEFVGIVFAQHWLRTLALGVRIMVG